MKWLGMILGSLFLLCIGALVLMDWDLLRAPVARKLSQTLGRTVHIDGHLDIAWSLSPRLHVEQVRLENAAWSQEPYMLAIAVLEVRVRLLSLLRGRLVIPELLLKKPVGLLEVSPQGEPNWRFATPGEPQQGPVTLPIIERLLIDEGQITYRDPGSASAVVLQLATVQEQQGEAVLQLDGQGTLQGEAVHVQSRLRPRDNVWHIEQVQASLGASNLEGQGSVDMRPDRPLLQATFRSTTLDIAQLQGLRKGKPATAESQATTTDPLQVTLLQSVNANLSWQVQAIILPQETLHNMQLHLQLQDGHVRIDPLQFAMGEGMVQVQGQLDTAQQALQGSLHVHFEQASLQHGLALFDIERATTATLDGNVSLALPSSPLSAIASSSLFQHLQIEESDLHYRDAGSDTQVDVVLRPATASTRKILQLTGEGHIQQQTIRFQATSDPLAQLATPSQYPFHVNADATLGSSQAHVELRLGDAAAAGHLGLQATLQGNSTTDLRPVLGAAFPALEHYYFDAALQRTPEGWQVSQILATARGIAVHAVGDIKTTTERPLVQAEIRIDDLQMPPLLEALATPQPAVATRETSEAPSMAPAAELLRAFDADITIQSRHIAVPNLALNDIDVHIRLREGQLHIAPLSLHVPGGQLAAEIKLDTRQRLWNGTIHSTLKELELAQFLQPFMPETPLRGVVSGQLNLHMVDFDPTHPERSVMPALVESLHMQDSQLAYTDPSRPFAIQAHLRSGNAASRANRIQIDAKGHYQEHPFTLRLRGAPLQHLLVPDRAYDLDIHAQVVQTDISLKSQLRRPFTAQKFATELTISGQDLQLLSPLLGIPLPVLPPYKIAGTLRREEAIWTLADFDGRVGDSDLSGTVRVEAKEKIPFIKAVLTSRLLDFDDLGPLIGAPPDSRPEETASPQQQREESVQQASGRALPNKPMNFNNLRRVNAAIDLRGKQIKSSLPLDNLTASLRIQGGRLTLNPLDFGVASGHVASRIELDATGQPARTTIEAEIKQVRLKEIVARSRIADDSFGSIGGQGKIWVVGNSVAEMLGSLDGGTLLLMSGGTFDRLLVELAGLDIGETLSALLSKKKSFSINCAFLDLHAVKGKAELKTFVVDTDDTLFLGEGSINFSQEELDLVIDPKPKDLSLFSARAPLHITGPFVKPRLRPGASAIIRGGASLAMLPAAPIAALIALVEDNNATQKSADSTYCSSFVEAIHKARQ